MFVITSNLLKTKNTNNKVHKHLNMKLFGMYNIILSVEKNFTALESNL